MKKLLLSLLLLSSHPLFARDGHEAGNGGGLWVCEGPNQEIRWMKLVDFYEATEEFNLTLDRYSGVSSDQILDSFMQKILKADLSLSALLAPYFEGFKFQLISTDSRLEIIDDVFYRIYPAQNQCLGGKISYHQLANYTHYGSILVQSYLFNHPLMSELDRAGLVLHEVVYSYLRDYFGDRDSGRARRIVGIVASNLSPEKMREKIQNILYGKNSDLDKFNFVKIKRGSFVMGSSLLEEGRNADEEISAVVISKDFEIAATEVTQWQWFQVMGNNPSVFNQPENCADYGVFSGESLCPTHPVENVSFAEVKKFIEKLNQAAGENLYRLPTEAEWEFAARAGTTTRYSFGDNPDDLADYAWYGNNSLHQTQQVARKKPNGNGLFDMHGNVAEWVEDVYLAQRPNGIDLQVGQEKSFHLFRGGSFQDNDTRSAMRTGAIPGALMLIENNKKIGFRLVRNLK
jgi:formylglycine-generating enzyme required for sulfatase activity